MSESRHLWFGVNGDRDDGGGIWAGTLSTAGTVTGARRVAAVINASFLARHARLPVLYTVSEQAGGTVAAYAVRPGQTLEPLGPPVPVGSAPCHLLVHPDGGWLYAACYGDGTTAAVPLADDGRPTDAVVRLRYSGSGPVSSRQEGPHAHSSLLSPDRKDLLVADLGSDSIWAHRLAAGRPEPDAHRLAMPAGFGPRHLLVHAGRILVTGELSGEVAAVAWDGTAGRVEQIVPAATFPARDDGPAHQLSHLAEVDGHLLVGVRGADTLSWLRLGTDAPVLTGEVTTTASPRHFAVVDDHVVVAGAGAGEVGVHRLDDGAVGPLRERHRLPGVMSVLAA
ncbi:lactonase family protein [Georgenia deserti]|uniref:Lactonase family protein n=1 Tax=Georgenia deserti TaxID=2093781 RepID=A0ABW4L6Z6_9MICO